MPFPDFFEQFGILSAYEFLPAEFCAQLSREMEKATPAVGGIWNPHAGDHIKEEIKKRKEYIGLPSETESLIREKLLQLMSNMAEHFGVELKDVQPIKFTR